MTDRNFDVVIVGAGIAGIGGAWRIEKDHPGKSFAIIEARGDLGGTWDYFRYPGIRSDSDMFTLGYSFHPWSDGKIIADGPAIKSYVSDVAREYEIDKKIHFHTKLVRAEWNSSESRWRLVTMHNGEELIYTCKMVLMCAGYYSYEKGYEPEFLGSQDFSGDILHPQKWPEDYDYAGKAVAIVGSGATAVTLAPAMAQKAASVTMVQRSPTYMVSMARESALTNGLNRVLPNAITFRFMRWLRILMQFCVYNLVRSFPSVSKRIFVRSVAKKLKREVDIETHFTPKYNPWEERLCLVPDNDFFNAVNAGTVSIITAPIERFTKTGMLLENGDSIDCDLIVTATGLELQVAGGAEIVVDGEPIDLAETFNYLGMMNSRIPNFVSVFGYTNASWTLRSDLVAEYFCKLMAYMDDNGFDSVTPKPDNPEMATRPFTDFSSGYFKRAEGVLPKSGPGRWNHSQNYLKDIQSLRYGSFDDCELEFARKAR